MADVALAGPLAGAGTVEGATDQQVVRPTPALWRRLRRSKAAQAGAIMVAIFIVVALVGPLVEPYDPLAQVLENRLQAPSAAHLLGTDALGRDVLSRLLEGSRISLTVGVFVGLIALAIGVPIGVVAAYFGEPWDSILMRAMDVLLAIPGILLAIGIVAVLGPGLNNVMIAIGVVAVPSFARVARAAALRTKEMPFVEAAHCAGASAGRILWTHLRPNIASPLIVLFSLRVATSILTAASLGYLGLGAQPPQPEWGAMLSDGRTYMRSAPYVAMVPGIAIMLVVLGFNLLGDGLRDALDPQTSRAR